MFFSPALLVRFVLDSISDCFAIPETSSIRVFVR